MNLGGYDTNDFNEASGNIILKDFLHKNEMLFCHFSEQDKTPNFDGYFEILEKQKNKSTPIGSVNVQIKTLNNNYVNENKKLNCSQYKYSCETKIFNAVKKAITLNPCYLFMVDTCNKRIFAKYITLEFVLTLNLEDENNKTIYFNDNDEITCIDSFYDSVKNLYFEKVEEVKNGEKNKFITTNNLTGDELLKLQKEFDYLNNIFDNELKYAKNKFFSKVWKFGLAYLKDNNSIRIGIYYICKGKQKQYFKQLDLDTYKECAYVIVQYDKRTDIHKLINNFVKDILEKIYNNNVIPLEYVANEILYEIAFDFLDRISTIEKTFENSNKPCVYYKDLEDINVLETYFYALKQYGYRKNEANIQNLNNNSNKIFVVDPFEEICCGIDMDINRRMLSDILKQNSSVEISKLSRIVLNGKFDYELIYDTIQELKNRKIKRIHRIWKSRNFNSISKITKKGIDRIENGYETSDYFENLEKLITILPHNYNCFIKHFFNLKNNLKIQGKYVYAFSNNDDFEAYCIKYNNNIFITKVNNELIDKLKKDMLQLLKKESAVYVKSTVCGHVFNLHFPLLMHTNYLFINQLAKIYGIDKLDLHDKDEIILE